MVVYLSVLSLCLQWLLWSMSKNNSAVSLTCQKHAHFLWRKFLMQETYCFKDRSVHNGCAYITIHTKCAVLLHTFCESVGQAYRLGPVKS